ncbi:MAG TPA: hypothetical protein VET87_08030 [Rubrivivax sp.]|nr:hypothetical protein [Rubrivivax sp.]
MQGTVGTADAHSAELVLATGERLAGVNFNRTQPGGVAAVRYANQRMRKLVDNGSDRNPCKVTAPVDPQCLAVAEHPNSRSHFGKGAEASDNGLA